MLMELMMALFIVVVGFVIYHVFAMPLLTFGFTVIFFICVWHLIPKKFQKKIDKFFTNG